MRTRRITAVVPGLLLVLAAGCGGGDATDVQDSPSAVPGMEESVEPTLGTGATDLPSEP